MVDPLVRLLDSTRCSDLGLLLPDFTRGRGFTSPCSSISACCFLRRYSCLMSSLRAFSSSLRMRSSSALRLEDKHDRKVDFIHNSFFSYSGTERTDIPSFVALELALSFQLLFTKPSLFCFALLLEEESRAAFCHFILGFLLILQSAVLFMLPKRYAKHIHGQSSITQQNFTLKKNPSTFLGSLSIGGSATSAFPSRSLSSDRSTSIS